MYCLLEVFGGRKGAFTLGNAAKFNYAAMPCDLIRVWVELNFVVVFFEILPCNWSSSYWFRNVARSF